jgi:hypothetical protein
MGYCCSGSTVDPHGDIKTLDAAQLKARLTVEQLALVIKVQANIRGYITRKRIRHMQYNAGMGGYVHEDGANDYDNPKVQVSIKHCVFGMNTNNRSFK